MIEQITELQAIAQSGLAYCKNTFDIERYNRILELTADLLSLRSSQPYEEVLELFIKDTGYATPKIDVRAACFKDNKLLLVQEKSDSLWTLPGGWADVNLSPAENAIKELREESGFDCSVIKLMGIFDKRKSDYVKKWPHVYKMFFLCKINTLEQAAFDKNEVMSVNFFHYHDIPPLSCERTNAKHIELCFKHFKDQSLCAEFQ